MCYQILTRGRRGRNRGVVVGQRGHHLLDARLVEHVLVGGHHGDVEPEQVLHFLPLEHVWEHNVGFMLLFIL